MTRTSVDVLVVGAGLAGTTAALSLAAAGCSVAITGRRAGGTALFSGAGQLFGPHRAALGPRSPLRVRRGEGGVPPGATRSALDRLHLLRERFPEHPFVRAQDTAERLAADVDEAVALLALPLALHAPAARALNTGGLLRSADLPLHGLALADDAEHNTGNAPIVLSPGELPDHDARWMARALGPHTRAAILPPFIEGIEGTGSLAFAAQLGQNAALQGRLVDLVAAHAQQASSVVLPPILGLDFDTRDRIATMLQEALGGTPVREAAAIADSAWGLRLHRHLRAQLAARHLDPSPGVLTLRCAEHWQADLEDGTTLSAAGVVLAAGGHLGRASAPNALTPWMREPTVPARAVEISPWQDHAFAREGVNVLPDYSLPDTPLPAVACGAVLAGHDPARDGTALGLALVSGLRAANTLHDRLGGNP